MANSKDDVRVVCRFRPQNRMEKQKGEGCAVETEDGIAWLTSQKNRHRFDFDYVFGVDSDQESVFNSTAASMVTDALKGYNSTIFAYGQTGSGKTYTMTGVKGNQGIIPRLVNSLFEGIANSSSDIEFTISVKYMEIYLEKIRDLLNPSQTNLRIREDANGMWVQGATEIYVSSAIEVLQVMNAGASNRAISATKMNLESSRSHSVFMIFLNQVNILTKSKKKSRILLIDLAGSEKVRKTEAKGMQLKEAQNINLSLSALGNVINALTTDAAHVPYRDSKLTKLLSDSLGGNSRCCLILCCSPNRFNMAESISTCRFGSRAKLVKNKASINQERSLEEYREMYKQAMQKSKQQEDIIRNLERELVEGSGTPISGRALSSGGAATTTTTTASTVLELQEKIEALELQLNESMQQNESLNDALDDKESDIAIQSVEIESQRSQINELNARADARESIMMRMLKEERTTQIRLEKLGLELEEQKLKKEQLESEKERQEREKMLKLESLGTWTNEWKPTPIVDTRLSIVQQKRSITEQYEKLFGELTNNIAALMQAKEAYSDLEEELKAHRCLLEKGELDVESSRALAKRAFAERQAGRLRAENERLQKITQCQGKLLTSWRDQLERIETAVEASNAVQWRREQQLQSIIKTLKSDVKRYRGNARLSILDANGANRSSAASMRAIHGGDGRRRDSRRSTARGSDDASQAVADGAFAKNNIGVGDDSLNSLSMSDALPY